MFIRIGEGASPFFTWLYGWDIKDIPYSYKDQVQKAKLYNLTEDISFSYNFHFKSIQVLVNPYCSFVPLLGPYFRMP